MSALKLLYFLCGESIPSHFFQLFCNTQLIVFVHSQLTVQYNVRRLLLTIALYSTISLSPSLHLSLPLVSIALLNSPVFLLLEES